jgi:ribonuclease E
VETAPSVPVQAQPAEAQAQAQAQAQAAPAEAQPAPVQVRPVPVAAAAPAAPATAPAASGDLNALLGQAGLTLASTDPEKLRAAQEAAAQASQPARVGRVRKPSPPPVNEPLIQVDTRQ